jgi:riboflavin biosynthesis pyrimidine reductase
MAEPDAGTQLTLLGGTETVDDTRLSQLYAYPSDLRRCWIRSNFIASLDGGATTGGKSGELGAAGDRMLFGLMRSLADVILVGAGTVRVENYGGAQLSVHARQARQGRRQAEVPPIAIVTRSGQLDRDMKVFQHTEVPPLILTSATGAHRAGELLGEFATVIDCSNDHVDEVDPKLVVAALASRGLHRVLTEGGPRLHDTLIAAGLLDELCLSMAPVIVGGAAGRIAEGLQEARIRMRRAHLLADDEGYLYARYVRET